MPVDASKPQFSMQPLVWLAVSFCVGICVGLLTTIPLTVALSVCLVLAPASLLFRHHIVASFLICITFAALGTVSSSVERTDISPDRLKLLYDANVIPSNEPIEVEGSVVGYPEAWPDGISFVVDASRVIHQATERSVSGRVRIFLPLQTDEAKADASILEIEHGTRLRVTCRLERENSFQNPGVAKRTDLLDRQGIDATANLKSPLLIEKLGREAVFIPLKYVYKLRAKLVEQFRTTFHPQTAGILIASTFGNKHFLDKQTADVFREGGTSHVLVISGLHITFIGGMILVLVRLFTRNRRVHAAVVISILWLYGVAVGAEPPVIRACVMFTILMVGYASYRTSSLLNSFGACIIVLLVWRPSDLFDPSFQLTVASVAGIICLGLPILTKLKDIGEWMPTAAQPFPPKVPKWLRRFCETIFWKENTWQVESKRQIWSARIFKVPLFNRIDELGLRRLLIFVFDGVVISFAVQLMLLPFTVYYFHRISFASILLNLWVGPMLAVESIVACIAVLIGSFCELTAVPFVTITEILNWLLVAPPSVLTDGGIASFRVPVYSGWPHAIYFIYFLPLVAPCILIIRWQPFNFAGLSRSRKLGMTAAASLVLVLAGLIVFHPYSSPRPDGRLHVEFLDVGQGDAAFITFPNGKTMLVDGGGRVNYNDDEDTFEPDIPRIGEMVVSEFLWEQGISKIDTIVATHADADHIQGFVDVSKNFTIGQAFFGRLQGDDPDLNELLAELDRFNVPQETLSAGDIIEIDGVKIDVLNPFPETQLSANNDSIVLRLTYGEFSFLLTGDIERESEDLILRSEQNISSTVVKVPHHGSRSSSTEAFVDATNAKYAIFSVGRISVFGHPHAEVVERWQAAGVNVITTGENGTIAFVTDGTKLEFLQFKTKSSK